jgi:tetratricopeptide (TPR) repeat protein
VLKPIAFVQKLFYLESFYFLFFLCSCLQFKAGFAQPKTIDSLKKILPSLHDSARVDCLLRISFQYGHVNNDSDNLFVYVNSDSATLYSSIALTDAKKINYLKGMANAFENLGEMASNYNFHDGENYFKQAILLYNDIHDFENLNWSYLWLGYYFSKQCKFDEAREVYGNALSYYKMANNEARAARTYGLLGKNYLFEGYYKKAFEYCLKDITIIQKEIKYQTDAIEAWLRLGELYQIAGDTATALVYLSKSADYSKAYNKELYNGTKGDINFLQNNYDSALYYYKLNDSSENNPDIGEIYLLKKDYNKAVPYFLKSLEIAKRKNDIYDVMALLDAIAKDYAYQKKWGLSLNYSTQLLKTAKSNHARQFIKDGSWLSWKIYDQEKKIDSAYKYRLLYDNINDSIAKDELSRNIAVTEMKTKEEQKQSQIDLLSKDNQINQQQLQKQSLLKNILIGSIIILFLLAAIIFRNTRLKRRNEAHLRELAENELQIQKLESQKQLSELEMQALRAQMNPHFIFNCLNSINRFIITRDAAKAADYLTKFAKLIRIVLQQSGKSFIPLDDELYCLQLYLHLEALRFEIPFSYEINCNSINTSSVMIPSLLIQPFVENAIWHGLHPTCNGNGKININMNLQNDILHCEISDNGIGRTKSTVIRENTEIGKKSLGIKLTQHRLKLIDPLKQEELGVTISDLTDEAGENAGTCVHIKIPVKTI